LEGAGGLVLGLDGAPLDYAAREDYLNPWFLALPAEAVWRDDLLRLARELA
jgi:3'(2'), 5'-bisphosphate nucleotidase